VVVRDASPARRKEMLHTRRWLVEQMEGSRTATIEGEVKKIIADWGERGELELLDFFSELTHLTSNGVPDRVKFREQLDCRFAH